MCLFIVFHLFFNLNVPVLFNSIGDKRLRRVMAHFKEHKGPCHRIDHRGGRKSNTNALTLEETNHVVDFIKNFAEDRGVSLPGRVPGFRRDDILLLPSSTPKSEVYRAYTAACQETGTFLTLAFEFCYIL